MCGIFGVVAARGVQVADDDIRRLLISLALISQARGSEASGLATMSGGEVAFLRAPKPASAMVRSREFEAIVAQCLSGRGIASGVALVGHSRLVTNGSQGIETNNQPVAGEHVVLVHNGIIVNDRELWSQNPDLKRDSQLDTEVLLRLLDRDCAAGAALQDAVAHAYGQIAGEANIAAIRGTEQILVLASNVGSLYYCNLGPAGPFAFASERWILTQAFAKSGIQGVDGPVVRQLAPGTMLEVSIESGAIRERNLADHRASVTRTEGLKRVFRIRDAGVAAGRLVRCAKCILPSTFPFIDLDDDGVCRQCREGAPGRAEGRVALDRVLGSYRRRDGGPDCIVALSGGRDSCYGLHVIKKDLGMNPIAYTYDWAMVTDEARRNCSRVCAELGVEHVIRSADILQKRKNIRMNVEAWLKRPDLGMIPLFMAGDKQFFHYASELSRQTGIRLVIFCGGNNLEVTRFKTGFCGVQDKSLNTMVGLDAIGKMRLLAYYAKQFLLNPAYINSSLWDTFHAFYSTYLGRGDFLYLYRYLDWDERQIQDTLSRHYQWESPSDSSSTWRIGDGTAAFYNYIYHTVAGFSEHDTFRSNQIRAGLISREDALRCVERENQPRYEAMAEYARLVGFSLDEAMVKIASIPKLY